MSSLSHPTGGILGGPIGLGSAGILGPLSAVALETPATSTERAELQWATWLLDLEVAGQVLRYATRDVVVRDTQGIEYLYRAGLDDFAMVLDGLQESQGLSVTDRMVNWALLARRGANLGRTRAILRYWDPGELLEGAIVALAGTFVEPEYGDPEAPARFVGTLKADATTDRLYPSDQARVDTSTWERDPNGTTYNEAIEGTAYATVFGYPGESDEVIDPPVACMPALLVYWNQSVVAPSQLLLGYGRMDCVGGQVWVRDLTADEDTGYHQEWLDVIEDVDDLGQVVTLVEVSDGAGVYGFLNHEYYFGMSSAGGKGGGSTGPDGSVMQTLNDVALFCLRNSGRQVDLQAQQAEADRLDRYKIDGMLNEQSELVPWFEGELMPLFPIARTRTKRGIYWRFLNWWATEEDACMHLDADLGQVVRTSSVREPEESIANHFVIEYQLNRDRTGARLTLGAEYQRPLPWWEHPDLLDDDRIVASPVCARSQAVYEIRQPDTIRSPFIWKPSTAVQILQHLAVRDAFPRRPVTYVGHARELMHLQRGDIVTVTDSPVSFSREVAIVDGVQLASGRLATVALEVLDRRRLTA